MAGYHALLRGQSSLLPSPPPHSSRATDCNTICVTHRIKTIGSTETYDIRGIGARSLVSGTTTFSPLPTLVPFHPTQPKFQSRPNPRTHPTLLRPRTNTLPLFHTTLRSFTPIANPINTNTPTTAQTQRLTPQTSTIIRPSPSNPANEQPQTRYCSSLHTNTELTRFSSGPKFAGVCFAGRGAEAA